MMKRWMLVAMTTLAIGSVAACDAAEPGGGLGDPTTTEETKTYKGVLIVDMWLPSKAIEDKRNDGCQSAIGADGADIDAVLAVDDSGTRPYYYTLETVKTHIPTGFCEDEDYKVDTEALGMPDASLYDGFVSLRGGWMVGSFEYDVELSSDMFLQVIEVGQDNFGASGADPYEVFIINDVSCVDGVDPDNYGGLLEACDAQFVSDAADGEAVLTLEQLDLEPEVTE